MLIRELLHRSTNETLTEFHENKKCISFYFNESMTSSKAAYGGTCQHISIFSTCQQISINFFNIFLGSNSRLMKF